MTFTVTHNKANNYLSVKYSALPTPEEFDAALQDFLKTWSSTPDINILYDMTSIDPSAVNSNLIHRFLSIREKYPERGDAKIAILVKGSAAFGVGRMYEILSGLSNKLRQQIKVFHDLQQAEEWIREG